MKKSFLFLALFAAFAMILGSCSKDKDSASNNGGGGTNYGTIAYGNSLFKLDEGRVYYNDYHSLDIYLINISDSLYVSIHFFDNGTIPTGTFPIGISNGIDFRIDRIDNDDCIGYQCDGNLTITKTGTIYKIEASGNYYGYAVGLIDSYTMVYNGTLINNSSKHHISVDNNIEHGTITASSEEAMAGDIITLTVVPESGYSLFSCVVGDYIPVTNNSFVMPSYDVTISAEFRPTPPAGIYGEVNYANESFNLVGGNIRITINSYEPEDISWSISLVDSNDGSTPTQRFNFWNYDNDYKSTSNYIPTGTFRLTLQDWGTGYTGILYVNDSSYMTSEYMTSDGTLTISKYNDNYQITASGRLLNASTFYAPSFNMSYNGPLTNQR